MGKGPLDHPRLLAIEQKLDDGELDEAQRMLAALGDVAFFRYATTYLATKLLFQRGRLAKAEVADRLRDLLRNVPYFPEASAMLEAAEDRDPSERGLSIPSGVGRRPGSAPQIEIATADASDAAAPAEPTTLPSIPRAAPVPQFTPPPLVGYALPAQKPIVLPDLGPLDPEPAPRPSPRPTKQGRYSEAPVELETVVSSPRQSDDGDVFVRSGPPRALDAAPRTLFEIATLLDGGRPEEALEALQSANLSDAEAAVMRARALIQLGRDDDALEVVGKLCSAPLLDPELRAAVARLLIDLGRDGEAVAQARRAHRDDPEPPIVRLTLAWAAVRATRSGGDPRLGELGSELLSTMKTRSGPRPELVLALRACLAAATPDAERAVQLAQRSLKIDHRCSDALVALAIASARMGRAHDARQAFVRLLDLDRSAAEYVARVLADHGVDVGNAEHEPRPGASLSGDDAIWEPVELALIEGRRRHTIVVFEELCRDLLSNISAERGIELPMIGTVAAGFFTSAPVLRDFAPFDLSLFGIARLDAALAVLYGSEPRPRLGSDDYAAMVLVGAYVGESLRQPHGGRWNGGMMAVERASVSASAGEWRPFRMATARIRQAIPIQTDDALAAALTHPGSDPWAHRLPCPTAPPCPWDPEPWPDPGKIDVLGRALSRSIIGRWCERFAEGPLDRSLSSLAAIDSYLGLVAPVRASRHPDEPWTRRIAVLTGAYLGEVLRSAAGGEWVRADGDELDESSYRVVLGVDIEACPIAHALSRIVEHGLPLMEYATRLVRRAS